MFSSLHSLQEKKKGCIGFLLEQVVESSPRMHLHWVWKHTCTVSAVASTYPTTSSQTDLSGGWHSRAGGVKNTSSGPHAWVRVWVWGLRGWHGGSESKWLETTVCIQCRCAHACSFMTALGYSKAVVSSSQLSCQLTAILSLLQTAPLSLGDEVFGNLCHSRAGG